MKFLSRFTLGIAGLILFPQLATAQRGYSSGAVHLQQQQSVQDQTLRPAERIVLTPSGQRVLVREQVTALAVPRPEEVVIEEYLNYHTHALPLPQPGEAVNLDLRWGNANSTGEAYLQLGLSTHRGGSMSGPPVNLSLVIDRSGSMSGEKMARTREALFAFARQLRPQDRISLVAFDHLAEVLLPAQFAGNGSALQQAIGRLEARGSTDMHSGILNGYDQLLQHHRPDQSSRMIILTDALTNTGIVDPEQIIAQSAAYQAQLDIDFVMVGVGLDLNQALAREMTQRTGNTFHFIHDPADIQKIFVSEAEALLSPVGKQAEVEFTWPAQLQLEQVYGYVPEIHRNRLVLPLQRLNQGLTQVILLRFSHNTRPGSEPISVQARLRYQPAGLEALQTHSAQAWLFPESRSQPSHGLLDPSVRKNVTIGEMALQLREMARFYLQGQPHEACMALREGLSLVDQRFPNSVDPDLMRVRNILLQFLRRMDNFMLSQGRRD